MDPVSQGALGAVLSQSVGAKSSRQRQIHVATAGILGMFGGLAADLDVVIRSNTDPLLFLTYHRHFTHSLFFILIGGLIVALFILAVLGRRWQLGFWQTFLLCTMGYATHGLLDTCTAYGTLLLWPLSETRYSWNIISIIDPLLTLPLLASIIIAGWRNDQRIARIGLAWVIVYLGIGWLQHQTAREMAENLAASRGHTPVRYEIKPSFGNILVWKSVYENKDKFYVDAFRVTIAPKIYEGTSASKLNRKRDFPWLKPDAQQSRDIDRFAYFADDFLVTDPANPNRIVDLRYSFVPHKINALFSIELSPKKGPSEYVKFDTNREQARERFSALWKMLFN